MTGSRMVCRRGLDFARATLVGRLLATSLAVLVAAVALSCSAAPPQIVSVESRLEYVHDLSANARYEQLTVLALVRDEDGFGDIESLYLLHDESELYWRLDGDTWIHERRSGEDWIGFAGITTADGLPLPRGVYRLVVMDASGEQDERRVLIDAPSTSEVLHREPEVSDDNLTVAIRSGTALFRIVSTSDDETEPVDRVLQPGEFRIGELMAERPDGVGFLYVSLDDYSGIVSGPFGR